MQRLSGDSASLRLCGPQPRAKDIIGIRRGWVGTEGEQKPVLCAVIAGRVVSLCRPGRRGGSGHAVREGAIPTIAHARARPRPARIYSAKPRRYESKKPRQ